MYIYILYIIYIICSYFYMYLSMYVCMYVCMPAPDPMGLGIQSRRTLKFTLASPQKCFSK